MNFQWDEFNRELSPLKDHEALCRRWQEAFAYPFVREKYNLTMPELIDYARRLLGGDARERYDAYASLVIEILTALDQAGVRDTMDLMERIEARDRLENFVMQSGISDRALAALLKYLTYWFIPSPKYLSGLVRDDPIMTDAIWALRGLGIRTNLDLLQLGRTPSGRKTLAESSGLPEAVLSELVNRADFSRLPWSSKATISNIIGAGYASLAELATASPEQLYADFFGYGKAIGKNLKLGNEIENSYRIAKIVPVVLSTESRDSA